VARGPVQTTTVGRALGTGGEGTVYADATRPDFVLKIMHKPTATSDAKTQAMLASPPSAQVGTYQGVDLVQIAWPQERLTDDGGNYVGFSMRFVDVSKTVGLGAWINLRERRLNNLSQDDRLRVHLAANLASVTEYVNQAGHALVDLKPLNVLAYRNDGYLCLVDCDGFRIQHAGAVFPASAYTPDFLAPEYQGGTVSASQLGEEQDRFALAVVIFQLLDNGIHPFAGNDGLSFVLCTRIENQRTFLDPACGLRPPSSSHYAFFADETIDLFLRAFTGPGDQRPSAAEWKQHLYRLAQQGMHMCGADPDHWHYGKGCPWCAATMQLPPPGQRSPVGVGGALPRFAGAVAVSGAAASATYTSSAPGGPMQLPTGAVAMGTTSAAATVTASGISTAAAPLGVAVAWAIGNWKKTVAAAGFLVLVASGVWAVTRPAADLRAPVAAHLDKVVQQESGLSDFVTQIRKNSQDPEVGQFEQTLQQIAVLIQSARSALENRDPAQADALLSRADNSLLTLTQQMVAFQSRSTPPSSTSASSSPPDGTSQTTTSDPAKNPNDDDPIGEGGFITPPTPAAKPNPNTGPDPDPTDPFGGDGGFIRPAAQPNTGSPTETFQPVNNTATIVQRYQRLTERADGARRSLAMMRLQARSLGVLPRGDLNALEARMENGLSDAADAIKAGRVSEASPALDSAEAAIQRLER